MPRNLYFSPFVFPFSFLDPLCQLFLPVSPCFFFSVVRRLRLAARSLRVSRIFRVFRKCPLLPQAFFFSCLIIAGDTTLAIDVSANPLKISLSYLNSQGEDSLDVSRRDRFGISRAPRSGDYNDAPPRRPRRAGMIIRNRFARLRDPCIHNVYAAQSGYSRSPIRVANESLGNDKRVSQVIATSLQ